MTRAGYRRGGPGDGDGTGDSTGPDARTRGPSLTLSLLEDRFAVVRLPPEGEIPGWALGVFGLSAVVRTPEELSIVLPDSQIPEDPERSDGWVCLRVEGPLDLAEVGILASLTGPLAEASVSVFVLSTYDTDYLLVPADRLSTARSALESVGHRVVMP